jgi:hypothetical protein
MVESRSLRWIKFLSGSIKRRRDHFENVENVELDGRIVFMCVNRK